MERNELADRFRSIRLHSNMSQKEFSRKTGISQGVIADIERGAKEPSRAVLVAIATECNISLDWLLLGITPNLITQDTKDVQSIPVYRSSCLPEKAFLVPLLDQRLSAGSGSYLPEETEIKALIPVPISLAKYGDNVAALTVEGDSMMPTLHRGDMVVCDSCGWSGEGIYAVRMSGLGFVKRITRKPGKIIIISDNPKYPVQEESEESQDIEIVGRVHYAVTHVD